MIKTKEARPYKKYHAKFEKRPYDLKYATSGH